MQKEPVLQYEPVFRGLARRFPPSLVEHLTHAVGPALVETNELLYVECLSYAEILFDLVARANDAIARQADASVFLRGGGTRLFEGVAEDAALAIVQRARNIARFHASPAFYNFYQAELGTRPVAFPEPVADANSLDVEKLRSALRNEEKLLNQQRERIYTVLQSSHKIYQVAERLADEFQRSVSEAGLDLAAVCERPEKERRFHVRRPISGLQHAPSTPLPRPLSALGSQHILQ